MSSVDLNSSQVKSLNNVYGFFDSDGKGLDAKKIQGVLQFLGRNVDPADIEKAILSIHPEGQGVIDFPHFLDLVAAKELNNEKPEEDPDVRDTFDAFDKTGSGRITAMSLRNALAIMGETTTDEEVREMFKIIGSQTVDIEKFKRLLINL